MSSEEGTPLHLAAPKNVNFCSTLFAKRMNSMQNNHRPHFQQVRSTFLLQNWSCFEEGESVERENDGTKGFYAKEWKFDLLLVNMPTTLGTEPYLNRNLNGFLFIKGKVGSSEACFLLRSYCMAVKIVEKGVGHSCLTFFYCFTASLRIFANSDRSGKIFLTSSLLMISTCNFRCRSSQSSLYFSHSSFVALIFFLRTSRMNPSSMACRRE